MDDALAQADFLLGTFLGKLLLNIPLIHIAHFEYLGGTSLGIVNIYPSHFIIGPIEINLIGLALQREFLRQVFLSQQHEIALGEEAGFHLKEKLRNSDIFRFFLKLSIHTVAAHGLLHLRRNILKRKVDPLLHRLVKGFLFLFRSPEHGINCCRPRFAPGLYVLPQRIRVKVQKVLGCIRCRRIHGCRLFRYRFLMVLRLGRRWKRILAHTVIFFAEARPVQALYDLVKGHLEVIRGCQHIGHIQGRNPMLPRMRLAENTSYNLLHIHLAGLIGQ